MRMAQEPVDEGLELRPEVKERLLRSLRAPRGSFISADEIRKRLNTYRSKGAGNAREEANG